MGTTCPRCAHRRLPEETHVHAGVCPACGVAYAKWRARGDADAHARKPPSGPEPGESLGARLRAQLLQLPEDMEFPGLVWRALVLAGLAVWTVRFGLAGIDFTFIGSSLLHGANLAFHEFGHLFFRPFGEFLTILGGSLFQLLLPLGLTVYFVVWQQDNVSASVALWWHGQNWVDLAPYIADAEYRMLPLVGGGGEESHDWGNLLTWMDSVAQAGAIARGSFTIGIAVMTLALAWGATLAWRGYRSLRPPA